MEVRRALFAPALKLLQRPTVAKLLADPRAMDVFVAAIRTRDRATALLTKVLSFYGRRQPPGYRRRQPPGA